MSFDQILQATTTIATLLQLGLAWEKRQIPTVGGVKMSHALNGSFVISRKRAYWLIGTIAVMMLSSLRVYFTPRDTFSMIPDDKLATVSNKQFVNETVTVDGKDFENCSFVSVILKFEGKHNFNLNNNSFSGPVRLSWDDASHSVTAAEVVKLLQNGNMIANGRVGFIGKDGNDVIILKDIPAR
jgi:hypothetical protein